MVHETLRKCYDDICHAKLNTLDELLFYYDELWQKNWHDGVVINNKDLTTDHYRASGRKMIESYYRRYAPFDQDVTIGTEKRIRFALDDTGRYRFQGLIDRLAMTPDGVYYINEYKTSPFLPSQEDIDNDRQLALYQVGVQKMWSDVKEVRLVWHYLSFGRVLISQRSSKQLEELVRETMRLIDEVESAEGFPPREADHCQWCEYPDLCPVRRHFYIVDALPANEYLEEPGWYWSIGMPNSRKKLRRLKMSWQR